MRPIIFLLLVLTFSFQPSSAKANEADDFKQYNPDIQKFEFARDYITSLGYIYENAKRDGKLYMPQNRVGTGFLDKSLRNLIADNIGLRVARNTLKKYQTTPNGLIQKTRILFENYCETIIAINNEERQLVQDAKDGKIINEIKKFNKPKFIAAQEALIARRQEASKGLLEASFLMQKILLSTQVGPEGQYNYLAISRSERKKLLSQIDGFYGAGFKGDLGGSQTYLQASVVAIRQILEDSSYQTIVAK